MTPAEWPPILVVLIAGALPTAVWRWLGVALADHVSEDSEILVWVRCVATALVAAVIATARFSWPSRTCWPAFSRPKES